MHILISGLYAAVIWLSLMAYAVILGSPFLPVVAIAGPIIISFVIVALIALEVLVERIWRWVAALKSRTSVEAGR